MNPEWNQTVIYKNIHLEQVLCINTHVHTHADIHTRTISKPPAVVHLLHMLWATEADVDVLYSH